MHSLYHNKKAVEDQPRKCISKHNIHQEKYFIYLGYNIDYYLLSKCALVKHRHLEIQRNLLGMPSLNVLLMRRNVARTYRTYSLKFVNRQSKR